MHVSWKGHWVRKTNRFTLFGKLYVTIVLAMCFGNVFSMCDRCLPNQQRFSAVHHYHHHRPITRLLLQAHQETVTNTFSCTFRHAWRCTCVWALTSSCNCAVAVLAMGVVLALVLILVLMLHVHSLTFSSSLWLPQSHSELDTRTHILMTIHNCMYHSAGH